MAVPSTTFADVDNAHCSLALIPPSASTRSPASDSGRSFHSLGAPRLGGSMIALIALFVCILALAILFENQRRRHRRYRAEQLVIGGPALKSGASREEPQRD